MEGYSLKIYHTNYLLHGYFRFQWLSEPLGLLEFKLLGEWISCCVFIGLNMHIDQTILELKLVFCDLNFLCSQWF